MTAASLCLWNLNMSAVRNFVRREPVLVIAALAALVTCFFVPPDESYFSYLDFRTLSLLYCLMTVVNGLRQAGLFSNLAHSLCERAADLRAIAVMLVLLCFFTSMLITNDVALLTFVPFAVVVMDMAHHQKELIHVVVLQTVAANLGSMLTPVGNPQNLYLYSYYDMPFGEFLKITFPVWAVSLVLLLVLCMIFRKDRLEVFLGEEPGIEKQPVFLHAALFLVCLLVVLRLIPWYIMLAVIVGVLLFCDRKLLLQADFMLLLTFVAFFVFSGNLARIDAVSSALQALISGREYLVSLLTSQIISNVPAALLLSGFTRQSHAILLGVNIGGLGTPIASLASLISLKLYSHSEHSSTGLFLAEFLVVNAALLILLSLLAIRLL